MTIIKIFKEFCNIVDLDFFFFQRYAVNTNYENQHNTVLNIWERDEPDELNKTCMDF